MLYRQRAPFLANLHSQIGRPGHGYHSMYLCSMYLCSSPVADVTRGGSKFTDHRPSASSSYDFFAKSRPTVTQARCWMSSPVLDWEADLVQ